MPYNGAGTFTSLGVPTFPAVTGDYILASYFNATMNDIFLGLSTALPRDGQAAMTANLPMGAFKITGLGNGSNPQDATTFVQVFTSPTFSNATLTGVPVAPTAAYGTNTMQIATMAAIQAAVALLPSGALPSVTGKDTSWVLTPNAGGTAVEWTQKSPVSTVVVNTSSGTWTCPAGITKAKVTVIGGGGGSNVNATTYVTCGGGGGGSAIKWLTVTPATVYTVTVGAGGAGATTNPGNGSTGGTSSFAGSGITTLFGGGGSGAAGSVTDGGIGQNGDLNITGGGASAGGSDVIRYQTGGSSLLAMSAPYASAGTGYGGGGGSTVIAGVTGNAGSAGVVIIEY